VIDQQSQSRGRIFAVANQKGGVGKTTTAVNVSAAVARLGKRVLLVDIDPQGNSTTALGIDKTQVETCMYDVLLKNATVRDALHATSVANLTLLPATLNLAGAELELVSALSREQRLKSALATVAHEFDLIIIDCPPSLGLLTLNALTAADALLIPVQAEYFALEGLGQLTRVIDLVRAHLNPTLSIHGVVVTMFDGRTNLARQVVDEVERHFPNLVFATRIPRNIRVSEAPSYGAPITEFDSRSAGALAYAALAEEVLAR
jgi:chromosome partitioning protein